MLERNFETRHPPQITEIALLYYYVSKCTQRSIFITFWSSEALLVSNITKCRVSSLVFDKYNVTIFWYKSLPYIFKWNTPYFVYVFNEIRYSHLYFIPLIFGILLKIWKFFICINIYFKYIIEIVIGITYSTECISSIPGVLFKRV